MFRPQCLNSTCDAQCVDLACGAALDSPLQGYSETLLPDGDLVEYRSILVMVLRGRS